MDLLQASESPISSLAEALKVIAEQRKTMETLEEKGKELERNNRTLRRAKLRAEADLKRPKGFAPWLHRTQHRLLFKAKAGGITWHKDLIREGLILKMQCGSTGYSSVVRRIPLLPSLRLLQQAVQFVKFNSGIFAEIFDLLEVAIEEMDPDDLDCQMVLDEMAIEKGVKWCRSNNKWLGHATFPSHKGIAGKALIIILAGIRRRWKCAVGAYLTSSSQEQDSLTQTETDEDPTMTEELITTGEAYKSIITQVMRRAEKIRLRVAGVTTDMGAENLAFWKVFGVGGSRGETPISSVQNPFRNAPFFILPDGIHLLKAIKTAMESNKIITLPAEIVESEGLPSNIVNYSHIQELYDFEEQFELKVAFRLKPENINCNKQFSKMKMGTHRAVVCHRTSVGLELLSEEKGNSAYMTTAWFIQQLNNFFDLITNRSSTLALSTGNKVVYEKSISLIKKTSFLFENMKIGEDGHWKPCQRGIMVLCNSLLGLQKQFLSPVGNYKFLCLGRFLSDCVENIFSLIRQRQAVPHAVAFFQNLKVVTLAQLSQAVRGSGYDYEEAESLPGVDMLEVARNKSQERLRQSQKYSHENLVDPEERVSNEEMQNIGSWEQNVLYDMAGSILHQIQSANVTVCNVCFYAAQWQEDEAHPRAKVAVKKEYKAFREDTATLLQLYPSDDVYQAVCVADLTFKKFRHKSMHLSTSNAKELFVQNLMYVWDGSSLPDCHQIGRKILEFFFKTRFEQYSNKLRQQIKDAGKGKGPRRNSKSCAMRDAANLITVNPKKKYSKKTPKIKAPKKKTPQKKAPKKTIKDAGKGKGPRSNRGKLTNENEPPK